jgi:hypothetical protein
VVTFRLRDLLRFFFSGPAIEARSRLDLAHACLDRVIRERDAAQAEVARLERENSELRWLLTLQGKRNARVEAAS